MKVGKDFDKNLLFDPKQFLNELEIAENDIMKVLERSKITRLDNTFSKVLVLCWVIEHYLMTVENIEELMWSYSLISNIAKKCRNVLLKFMDEKTLDEAMKLIDCAVSIEEKLTSEEEKE
ncbi:MAG: hypothetical protein ABC579_07165 [Candidatus Methanosuratincola petrocarbonis]